MKFFCPLPFNSVSVGPGGVLRTCCHQESGETGGLAADLDASGILNHNAGIQAELSAGRVPKSCEVCRRIEESGGFSPRLEYLDKFGNMTSARDEEMIEYLDLTLGNHCNLACLMCSPWFSERLNATWSALVPGCESAPRWWLSLREGFLERVLPGLKMITLTGGEPFISAGMLALLGRIGQSGYAARIELRIFTNMTCRNRKLMELLARFKGCEIVASIDSVGPEYEWIRYPAQWREVVGNLKDMAQNSPPGVKVSVHTTAMAFNWAQIPLLLDTISSVPGLSGRLPSVTRLEGPAFLRPDVLARRHYERGSEKIEEAIRALEPCSEAELRAASNWRAILTPHDSIYHERYAVDYELYLRKLELLRNRVRI